MAVVNREDHLGDRFREIERRLRVLELGGRFQAPIYTADPASPVDGDIWVNSTTARANARVNGSTIEIGSGYLGITLATSGPWTQPTASPTTPVAVDSTNLSITFTAPASGRVIVSLEAWTDQGAAGNISQWTLLEGATEVTSSQRNIAIRDVDQHRASVRFLLTGLSAGSHTYKWAWLYGGAVSGTPGTRILSPALMAVQDATLI